MKIGAREMESATRRAGDRVRLLVLPPWMNQLPPETRAVFPPCVGKVFTVREIAKDGRLRLWVRNGRDRSNIARAVIVWVEPEYVVVASHIPSSRIPGPIPM